MVLILSTSGLASTVYCQGEMKESSKQPLFGAEPALGMARPPAPGRAASTRAGLSLAGITLQGGQGRMCNRKRGCIKP